MVKTVHLYYVLMHLYQDIITMYNDYTVDWFIFVEKILLGLLNYMKFRNILQIHDLSSRSACLSRKWWPLNTVQVKV